MPRVSIDRLQVKVPRGADARTIQRAVAQAIADQGALAGAAGARAAEAAQAVGSRVAEQLGPRLAGGAKRR
jgi:hypothetical protein